MRILIDQNISYRIIARIQEAFSDIHHVREFQLSQHSDGLIFEFARSNNFDALLTLDEDFHHIVLLKGIPPKIIWLRTQNCTTEKQAKILLEQQENIFQFIKNSDFDIIEIIEK